MEGYRSRLSKMGQDKLKIENIDRILVLGWGLIGDLFIRVPLIEALKARFPDAEITVVVDPACTIVLENHPACEEVIAFSREKRPYKQYIKNFVSQIIRLRKKRFDLCVNLYCGGGSPLVSQLTGARLRVCFDHTAALRRANNLMVARPSFCDNWARDLGRMLTPLGIAAGEIRRGTSFYCREEAKQFARSYLTDNNSPTVAINLGAGADEKRWPVDRFVEFAIEVNREYGLIPLVFTNPGMTHLADEFVSRYQSHGMSLHVPLISLDRVAALMLHCDYVVTGDTSLMHLAFALKRPTLALFTYSRPETVAPEDVPHICCFVAGDRAVDACGKPMGTTDIPLNEVHMQFRNLVTSTNTASSSRS